MRPGLNQVYTRSRPDMKNWPLVSRKASKRLNRPSPSNSTFSPVPGRRTTSVRVWRGYKPCYLACTRNPYVRRACRRFTPAFGLASSGICLSPGMLIPTALHAPPTRWWLDGSSGVVVSLWHGYALLLSLPLVSSSSLLCCVIPGKIPWKAFCTHEREPYIEMVCIHPTVTVCSAKRHHSGSNLFT